MRAGKDLLKDRWGIRTWQQFFDRFGDLCREAGEVVRHVEPDGSDPNRARWPNHPIWDIVCAEMNDDLTEMRSGADPKPMKEVHGEEHIAMLFRNLLGSSIRRQISPKVDSGVNKFGFRPTACSLAEKYSNFTNCLPSTAPVLSIHVHYGTLENWSEHAETISRTPATIIERRIDLQWHVAVHTICARKNRPASIYQNTGLDPYRGIRTRSMD